MKVMTTTSNIQILLRSYATHQKSAQVNVAEFCEYIKKYAQHHASDQSDLLPYINNATELVKKELEKLAQERQILYVAADPEKKEVIVIPYYLDKCIAVYQNIKKNPAIPYPFDTDLPKNTPPEVLKRESADVYLGETLGKDNIKETALYCLQMPRALPSILCPTTLPTEDLMAIALSKFQMKLQKDEFHDYFLKKLQVANPGKDLTVKNFFKTVAQKSEEALRSIKNASDTFYQWNQLCFFVRQDYEKVTDLTAEDISLLQSIYILEFCVTTYRNKAQQNLQKETALKNLELNLNKAPYYFTRENINMFSDSRGVPLLGQYSDKDLNDYIQNATTESEDNKLPPLLTFKGINNTQTYVLKAKVLPLIVRLCTDARETIRDQITKDCFNDLKNFSSVPEMKNQELFEKTLENAVKIKSPILYALLNAPFLKALQYESRGMTELVTGHIHLFTDGELSPYSELLMLSKEEILTDARILLPVWYTIPGVSWLVSLFKGQPKQKKQKPSKHATQKKMLSSDEAEVFDEPSPMTAQDIAAVSRKEELKQAALEAEKHYVPQGSTIERELSSYEHTWNRMLSKQARDNLTEDVISLIRDYMRKILRTLRANNFTPERINNLATTLVKTPGMQKIQDQAELHMYVQLYMVKLIKGL